MRYIVILFAAFFVFPAHAESAKVIASIKPLHSLVAAVMEGSGDAPVLLVDGKASPHHFALKPSQERALRNARLVFYVGDDFELFLHTIWAGLPKTVMRVPMSQAPNLTLYPVRMDKDFEPHDHGDEDEHEHAHERGAGRDLHYWLMTENARAMVMEIARQLSIAYPNNRELYFDNARKVSERLRRLHGDLDPRMVALQGKPFIVFHDAYQYFEKDYGLTAAGSITLHPEQGLQAKHVRDIRERIKTKHIFCVFREPSFDGKIVDRLLEGTQAKSGVLDPEGALLSPGPELYFQLLEGIASGLERCLLSSRGGGQ